jgi:hypothetical protein
MAKKISLSVDQLISLLRMYLAWPKHVSEQPDKEAEAYFAWLVKELELADLKDISGGLPGVKHFIASNPDLVSASKYIKSRELQKKVSNEREEMRVHINTQVFLLVYDCLKDVALEGTIIRGMMMDLARNGMRLQTNVPIPTGSILSMTVANTGDTVALYHLTGEVRWITTAAETNQLGLSIFNIEDFELWEKFFTASQKPK